MRLLKLLFAVGAMLAVVVPAATTSAATGQASDPLLVYCQQVANSKSQAACLNESNLKHARNVASYNCKDKKKQADKAACVEDRARSYFKQAAKQNTQSAKAFTNSLNKVLNSAGGNKDKPAKGFEKIVAGAATGTSAGGTPSTPDQAQKCTTSKFFGLVPWYEYLGPELDNGSETDFQGNTFKCDVKCFNIMNLGKYPDGSQKKNECGQSKSDIPLVLIAIIDDLLRIAGLVAVGYVIYGAFRYTTSQGSPDQTAKAQSTILNALIGLALATVSVAFVSFLGNKLGG